MKEYIERAAVLSYPIRKDHCDKEHANEHFMFGIESVMEYVENLPAADVVGVRHGRWERFSTASGIISRVRCSVCSGTQPLTFESMPYCPKCGARMDKGDEIYG